MDNGVRRAGAATGRRGGGVWLFAATAYQGESLKGKKNKRYQPRASMPGGLPKMGLSPGVELVPGVGASLRGVGVLDFRPGVEDLSFCGRSERQRHYPAEQPQQTDNLRAKET